MADPASTPVDTDIQLIQTEAALRRANKDQIDSWELLKAEFAPAPCGWIKRAIGACNK